MKTYWHRFICTDAECKKEPIDIEIRVRTSSEKRPGRVRCHGCGHAPDYVGFEAETGTLADVLRVTPIESLKSSVEAARKIEGWTVSNEATRFDLFAWCSPFQAIGTVRQVGSEWTFTTRFGGAMRWPHYPTADAAKTALLEELRVEHGFVV
jgi:hypothetical protein